MPDVACTTQVFGSGPPVSVGAMAMPVTLEVIAVAVVSPPNRQPPAVTVKVTVAPNTLLPPKSRTSTLRGVPKAVFVKVVCGDPPTRLSVAGAPAVPA